MLHISAHYAGGMQYEQLRPDYFVIDYMWQNSLLSHEDYELARKYTERKHCLGLSGDKTEKMRRMEERSLEHRHNLDREKRQMKKEKGTSKSKEKGKGTRKALKYSETRPSPTSSSGSKNAV